MPPELQRELEFEAIERGLSVDELILHKLAVEKAGGESGRASARSKL
jgi:hypothetical protein